MLESSFTTSLDAIRTRKCHRESKDGYGFGQGSPYYGYRDNGIPFDRASPAFFYSQGVMDGRGTVDGKGFCLGVIDDYHVILRR